jgi:hypothetical protein
MLNQARSLGHPIPREILEIGLAGSIEGYANHAPSDPAGAAGTGPEDRSGQPVGPISS